MLFSAGLCHQFGNTDAKLAKQMMRLDMFGYLYQLGFFSWCLNQMFFFTLGLGFSMFFPIETRYQLSLLPQPEDFPALLDEGKARVAQCWAEALAKMVACNRRKFMRSKVNE